MVISEIVYSQTRPIKSFTVDTFPNGNICKLQISIENNNVVLANGEINGYIAKEDFGMLINHLNNIYEQMED